MRMVDVVDVVASRQLLSDEVFLIVDGHEDAQRTAKQEEVLYPKLELKLLVFLLKVFFLLLVIEL